jgi:iron(III) transport system substrate-binding protein
VAETFLLLSAAGEVAMKHLFAIVIITLAASTSAWSQSAKPSSAAELATYMGNDRERVLFDGARREGKLVWYTTLAADQNKTIAAAFEKTYPGVSVDTFRTGSSALAQRLLTEARARRHIADAIETTPPGLITFRDNQLLLPYTSPPKRERRRILSTGPPRASLTSAFPTIRAI